LSFLRSAFFVPSPEGEGLGERCRGRLCKIQLIGIVRMALKVVGVDLADWHTVIKTALERLGVGPCYHMAEVFPRPEHIKFGIGWRSNIRSIGRTLPRLPRDG